MGNLDNQKIIDYEKWCPKCKNNFLIVDKDHEPDPCDECLDNPVMEDGKPQNFKEE